MMAWFSVVYLKMWGKGKPREGSRFMCTGEKTRSAVDMRRNFTNFNNYIFWFLANNAFKMCAHTVSLLIIGKSFPGERIISESDHVFKAALQR